MMTDSCQILCIICLQLTSSFNAAIISVRSVSQDIFFCRLCLGSLFSIVSFKIKYFKPVSVHLGMFISSVPVEFGRDTKMLLSVLFMEIPLFLMYLASWQEAFWVRGWILLFRLIYGRLGADSCHLFRKKFNGLISHPRAKQASVRILKIYVDVQKNFHLRKQGDLPEQTAIHFRILSAMNLLLVVFFLMEPLWQQLCSLTPWELLSVEANFLWWKDSLSTNWDTCSNSSAGDQGTVLNVKSVPEKDGFFLAFKCALTQNLVLPVNIDVS